MKVKSRWHLDNTSRYKKWLDLVGEEYQVEPSKILTTRKNPRLLEAKIAFLWMCCRDGIDIYMLSIVTGRHRSTFHSIMKRGKRNKSIEDKIINNAKIRDIKEGI